MNTPIHDIYPLLYQPFWETPAFRVTILIVFLILFFVVTFFIIKIYRKKRIPKLRAWEWALQELELLDPYEYTIKLEFKEFYFSITEIIKHYLLKRYQWHVQEKTDSELIQFLVNQKFDRILIEKLNSVLQGSLLIKFADSQTLREQAIKDKEAVIFFIESTIPTSNK